jgi:signal peptidase II
VNLFWWIAGVALADQAAKILAIHFLQTGKPVYLVPSFFWLHLVYNPGAFASIMHNHPGILAVINSIALLLIIWWGAQIPKKEKRLRAAMGLVAGGALGNLADRFFRGGHVVDFLDVHWMNKVHWPVFNIADVAISVGVGLIFLDLLLQKKKQQAKPAGNK